MEHQVTLDTYEAPAVLGSFVATDVLGQAEGAIVGSTLPNG